MLKSVQVQMNYKAAHLKHGDAGALSGSRDMQIPPQDGHTAFRDPSFALTLSHSNRHHSLAHTQSHTSTITFNYY